MGKKIIIFLLLCYLVKDNVFASIHLNEIYPAPVSGEKEWIEIYNDEDKTIDLTNYFLTDLANNKIPLESNSIASYSYILGICSNVLNNTGDTVYLKNNLGETIDTVSYSGTFSSDKTYVRCSDNNWYTLTTITKNYSNETTCQTLTPTETPPPTSSVTSEVTEIVPTPTITLVDSPTISKTSYDNIFISEVMVNPPIGEEEWVEIHNNNDFPVSLIDWYIDDIENAGSLPKLFSLTIPTKGYGIFQLTSSVFNNDTDQVRLLEFDKNLKDSFEYGSATQGRTWARTDFSNDNFCLQEPSKNSVNNSCLNPTSKPSSTSSPISNTTSTTVPTLKKLSLINYQSTINNKIPVYLPSFFYSQPLKSSSSPKVLGATTKTGNNNYSQPLVRSLSFLSLGYSLLTIVSVLVKMKLC